MDTEPFAAIKKNVLGADVPRPSASVSAIVDEGNIVMLGSMELYMAHLTTDQLIPTCEKIVQLEARSDPHERESAFKW